MLNDCKNMQDLAFEAKLDISQEPAKLNFHVKFGRFLIRSWKNNQVLETHAKILLLCKFHVILLRILLPS